MKNQTSYWMSLSEFKTMTGVLKKNYVVAKETFFLTTLHSILSIPLSTIAISLSLYSYPLTCTHVVLMLNHSTLTTDTVLPGWTGEVDRDLLRNFLGDLDLSDSEDDDLEDELDEDADLI